LDRRTFLGTATGGLLAPLAAEAQATRRTRGHQVGGAADRRRRGGTGSRGTRWDRRSGRAWSAAGPGGRRA